MLFGMIKAGDVQQACGSNSAARELHVEINGIAEAIGAHELQEAAVGLVRSRFLEPTRAALRVCEADEVSRRFAVSPQLLTSASRS